MNRYIDHSATGGAPTIYERGKPPGGTVITTEQTWVKKVPPARLTLIEDANRVDQVAKAYGVRIHNAKVVGTRPNLDGTVDAKVEVTAEQPKGSGIGIAGIVIAAVVVAILGVAGVAGYEVYSMAEDVKKPVGRMANLLSYIIPIGAGFYLGGKAGFSPWVGAGIAGAGVWLYKSRGKGSD